MDCHLHPLKSKTQPDEKVKRAERTREAVAVSGINARGGAAGNTCGIPSTNFGVARGKAPAGYLESNANVSVYLRSTCDRPGFQWFIPGECQNGHRFAKTLVCGKEFCSVCGEDGSVAHLRRFARWLSKVQQFESMGYFVFTIPQELRAKYRTRYWDDHRNRWVHPLSDLAHDIQELLKRFGYSRGLRRWHYFGDKSTKYHPHLNVLTDGGYLAPGKMKALKTAYARLLGADVVDVNYRYRLSPGKMVHSLKYVTRATFRDYDSDLELAMELKGFRNMVVWGRGCWDSEPSWSLAELSGEARAEVEDLDIEAIEALVDKRCPVCGERIEWEEALPIGLLDMVDKRSLGAGYWRLTDNKSPPGRDKYHPKYPLLGYLANIKHFRLEAAKKRAEAEAAIEADYQTAFWRDILN
ncbi:hypothetical protein ES705_31009 [subsurface metagenome]